MGGEVKDPAAVDLRVAAVGAGLVGAGWAIAFAAAGVEVALHDAQAARRGAVMAEIEAALAAMARHGLVEDAAGIAARIAVAERLGDAVAGADYVQESVFEEIEVKRAVSAAIAEAMGEGAVVGSSTSGFPASAFTEGLARRARFLVVHPVNPPHLVPVVEIVPAPWTEPAVVPFVRALMRRIGRSPVVLTREIPGFVLNRLQGALLDEAWHLFEEGYASAADIDATISQGLGLRWSFMGPFETIDLNAPGGIADYARRFGPMYLGLAEGRPAPRRWSDEAVERATAERRAAKPADALDQARLWRDERLMALLAHRRRQPPA